MEEEDKAIISSMITHYITSEELVERTKPAELLPAIVVSYSALEGLIRWIGYSHPDIREEFFRKPKGRAERDRQDQERRLAKGKSLVDVAVYVLECEKIITDEYRSIAEAAVRRLQKDRDSIAHVTNMHELDGTQLRRTWDTSQDLVQRLILRKLGFDGDVSNPVMRKGGE